VEGRNLRIDTRSAGGRSGDEVRTLISELLDLRPQVLATGTVRLTRAVQEQTRSVPIVMMGAGDQLASGLVQSLSHPDGNTTGITDIFPSIAGKWLELLKQCVPTLARAALVLNPDRANASTIEPAAKAGASLGVKVIETPVRNANDIEYRIEAFAAEPDGGLIVLPPPFLPAERQLINRIGIQHRLPMIYQDRDFAVEGGLLSYGADLLDMHRRGVPPYIDRILRGATPGELPVQFPTKFTIVVNLKTARAMGLTIAESFLNLADEVIE
jgi:putative tryptophan/tyrosine transport system substrate-binding protein